MARKPSPWWWSEEQTWCVNYQGKRHNLGKHPPGAAPPKKSARTGKWNAPREIEEAFHKLLTEPTTTQACVGDSVLAVLDSFLIWCAENRAKRTWEWYKMFADDFVNFMDNGSKLGRLPVAQLNTGHVTRWLQQHTDWNSSTKKGAITSLTRSFNWACKNAGLQTNPIKGMEKPQANKRTQTISVEDFETALQHAPVPFRELLVVSYDTGSRPQEIKELEARHVQIDKKRAVLPTTEAKGRKQPRAIYFTDRSLAIVQRLCQEHPTGKLFLNKRGQPWNAYSVKCAFANLERASGVAKMKKLGIKSKVTTAAVNAHMKTLPRTQKQRSTGKIVEKPIWILRKQAKEQLVAAEAKEYGVRLHHYMLRHSRITHWLEAGVDSHVVAKLVGHSDTKMLDRHYSHIDGNDAFMLENVNKASPPSDKEKRQRQKKANPKKDT